MQCKPCSMPVSFLWAALFSVIATINVQASDWISPDKQWEYKSATPSIVRAHTQQEVLDLSGAVPAWDDQSDRAHEVEVVWAPDSKRVAVNYGFPGHRFYYRTTVLYQLRDNKWMFLRSPVDSSADEPRSSDDPNYDEFAIMAKKYLPKNRYSHETLYPSTGDLILTVQKWTDPDTAIFHAHSDSDQNTTIFYTLKVDGGGNWKLVKAQALSGKEAEKAEESQ